MDITYNISKDGIRLIKDLLEGGLRDLLESTSQEYPQIELAINELRDTFFEQWTMTDSGSEDLETIKRKNTNLEVLYIYSDFLAKSCLLAYLGKFDNDKNMDKLIHNKTDELVKSLIEEKKEQQNTDIDNNKEKEQEIKLTDEERSKAEIKAKMYFKFGYEDLSIMLQTCIENMENIPNSKNIVDGKVTSNLLGTLREDLDFKSYLNDGYIDKDIKLIALMGNISEEELVVEILNIIKKNEKLNSYLLNTTEDILCVYKYFFQDGFGLHPYKGILSVKDNINCLLEINGNNYKYTNNYTCSGFKNISTFLKDKLGLREEPDRQFNISKIIDAKDDETLYFPHKILEYAMGRELTYNLTYNVYKNHSRNGSWEEYCTNYVKRQVERCVLETIYKTIELKFCDYLDDNINNITWLKDTLNRENFKFTNEDFRKLYSLNIIESSNKKTNLNEFLSYLTNFSDEVNINLKKLMRTMCSGIAVVRYNNLGGTVNSVRLRIVDTTGKISLGDSTSLFSHFTTNTRIKYDNGYRITDKVKNDNGAPLAFDIIEFNHDFNPSLSSAEPLFGYTAVELFRNQKKEMNWNRILLGEDIKGSPIFASKDNPDDLPMQRATIHNLMAGSRAGKGLMTMTLLASAVASEKPIFYIDRKPDMATLFYGISNGNMFVVNGGSNKGDDQDNFFGENGSAVDGWKQAYDSLPSYLKDTIVKREYHASSKGFGDFVYYRACLFMLALLFARKQSDTKPEIYNQLGGSKGLVMVIDEFKNWQMMFEIPMFGAKGVFFSKMFKYTSDRDTKSDSDNYDKKIKEIKRLEMELSLITLDETAKDYKKQKLAYETKMKDKEECEKQLQEIATPLGIYCTTVINKIYSDMAWLKEYYSAGWKNTDEEEINDLFLIAQHLEYSEQWEEYETNKDGAVNKGEVKNGSFLRGLFDAFPHVDWFFGYNAESEVKNEYVGATKGEAKKWIADKQYWGYVPSEPKFELENLKKTPENITYFKPFLVLNKQYEDDPESPKKRTIVNDAGDTVEVVDADYEFVRQCRKRVNDTAHSKTMWDKVRLKHLGNKETHEQFEEDARLGIDKHYNELNEGIGFEGLARLTKIANYEAQCAKGGNPNISNEFNPLTDLGESKQIADFAAKQLGYSCYQDYLYDLSPKGIFSIAEMVACIIGEKKYNDYESRLPLFIKYNVLDADVNGVATMQNSEDSKFNDPRASELLKDVLGDNEEDDISDESVDTNRANKESEPQSNSETQKEVSNNQADLSALDKLLEDESIQDVRDNTNMSVDKGIDKNQSEYANNENTINELLQEEHIPDVTDIDDEEETENEEEFESEFDGDFGNVMSGGNETHKISFNEFKGLTIDFVDKLVSDVCDSLEVMMKPSELGTYMRETREKIYNDDTKVSVLIAYCKETYPDMEVDF